MKSTSAAETIIHAVWEGDAEGSMPVGAGSELVRSASAYATRCSRVGVGAGAAGAAAPRDGNESSRSVRKMAARRRGERVAFMRRKLRVFTQTASHKPVFHNHSLSFDSLLPREPHRRPKNSVMMAAGAVDMAVSDFLGGRGSDFADRDVEMERHPGEGMIAVEGHLVSLDFRNNDDLLALIVGGFELHPLFELFASLDLIRGNHGDLLRVRKSISFLGRDRDRERVAGLLALHDFFKTLHDLTLAMKVGKGTSILGGVDDVLLVVGEGVIEQDNRSSGDGHEGKGRKVFGAGASAH